MDWIYLSPHFDDAAFSCGGLIWKQSHSGQQVAVWTICAGDPPPGPPTPFAQYLHDRWGISGNPVARRRREDAAACRQLGAAWQHLAMPDCIYRRSPQDGSPLYTGEGELFGPVHPHETALIDDLRAQLAQNLPSEANIVCPLTIGGHADHRLVRAAAEGLGRRLWYYADYPYVQMKGASVEEKTKGMLVECFHLSQIELYAWIGAAAQHASQIASFWVDAEAMASAIRDYYRQMEGICLWRRI